MTEQTLPVAIVLAAGEGTRMKSAMPKVLHGFAGRSLLGHVLAAADAAGTAGSWVVVGHGREAVTAHLADIAPAATAVVQKEQRGTGHAVRTALDQIEATAAETVLVLPGDAPLLRNDALRALVDAHHATGAAATMLTSEVDDPSGYGRVIRGADGSVSRVVEHRDASADELLVREISALVYVFDGARLRSALGRLSTDNSQGEEYLPDVVGILRADGLPVIAVLAPAADTAGVNDRVQLAAAAATYNARLLEVHMRAGVTVQDPASTWVDADVSLSRDVTLLPGTDLRGLSRVDEGAVIGPQTSLTDTAVGARSTVERAVCRQSVIGADVSIGPYAYLRPGTRLADDVHVGTYVELKNSEVGAGSKVPHLSYVGDATIGERTNIGAATIFVNYDGAAKHRSTVGSDVRIGSDNTLVAPVEIGDGAYSGAGTVIRQDVPAGSLAVSMGPQRNIEGWVARKRPPAEPASSSPRGDAKTEHPDD
ncbi:MAG: bifunctional UDP-N-acetylglucosamine diphosphorylase/glucosamine-1-phosphate N-acetyltransferase GlmU [Jatrophihabitans sp.]